MTVCPGAVAPTIRLIEEDAAIELSRTLEKIGNVISIKAEVLAKHRGGITITEADIRLAVASMKLDY